MDCLTILASIWGAPAALCLITMASGFMASRFRAVSIRVSPFTTLLVVAEILMVSALSLFPAISKDVLVLVLASKKRFTTVFPLRVGTFFISLVETSIKDAAVSRIRFISSTESSLMPRMSLFVNFIRGPQTSDCLCSFKFLSVLFSLVVVLDDNFVYAVLLHEFHDHRFP